MNNNNKTTTDVTNDSNYKKYTSAVDSALRSFENTSEWADLIAALGKLNKVLNSYSKYTKIPRKVLIGKRLAQCLHPSLPNGVHLKALETYNIIFRCIGPHELSLDIFIYSCGLFPLLSYAAINVRPVLLSIYENHFVPLNSSIRPAMTGLLMGLLPGFENASEYFERMQQLLESFSECVDKSHFYTCMWECISCNSAVRCAGLNFIIMHFDKKQSMEDQIYLMGTNICMLVQALCLSLEDSAYLVQRCVLDLLISCFPIHKCQLPRSDILNVLTHAVTILLRRDMSLNRRLNAWLLGTDLNGIPVPFIIPQHLQQSLQQQQQSQLDASSNNPAKHSTNQLQNVDVNYFNIFTKDILILAIKSILNSDKDFSSSSSKQNVLLSLKTMISLLDRPEIVSTILNDLLLDVLRTLYRECHTNLQENVRTLVKSKVSFTTSLADESLIRKIKLEEKQAAVEIYKTANILFTKFDPSYIWNFIAKLFGEACKQSIKLSSPEGHSSTSSSPPGAPYGNIITIREFVDIVTFLLDKLSLETYFEMNTQHFPNMLIHIVQTLQENYKQLSNDDLVSSLKLCSNIITRIISYCHSISMDYVRNRTGGHKRGKQFREVGASNCTTANVADDKAAAEMVNDVNAGEVDEHNNLDDGHDFEMVGEIVNKQFLNNNADNNDDNDDVTVTNDSNEVNDSTRNCGNDHQSATKIIKDVNCRFLYQAGYVNRNSSLFTFIDKFLTFFEAVVENRIVSSSNLTNLTIDYLFTHSNKTASWKDYHSKISKVISTKKINFKSKAEHETLLNHMCLLLSKSLSLSTYNASFNDIEIPAWFQNLFCLCLLPHDFGIQYISIRCIFQLIHIWSSSSNSMHATASAYNEHDDDNDDDVQNAAVSDGDDVVPCLSYHQAYLNILNEKTCFYKLAGGSVWMTMLRAMVDGESTGSLKMVELFNDIHQHAPHSHICEEVITEGMLSRCQNEKVTATMQFLSFWQKLKEMDTLITRKKTYEKAIVIMLDDLDSDNQVYSSLAKSWLTSCVKVNELSNIIEPVLKVLLHPDTARISVQQLEKSSSMQPNKSLATSSQLLIQQSDQQEQNEQKVVAVSNEGGNIMYHVDSSNRFKPPKVVSSFEDCPALALTTLSDKGSSTRKAAILLDNYLSTNRPMPSNVTLRVNPFGSSAVSDDEDDDLVYGTPKKKSFNDKMAGGVSSIAKSAIRLDKETCLKEKIIFEDEKHGATNDHQESVDFKGTDQNNFSSEHNNLTITSIRENDVGDSSSNDKGGDGVEYGSNKVESSSGDEVAIEIINNIIEELFDDGLKEELKEMGGPCDFTEFVGYNANDGIGVNDNTNNINDINHNVNNTNDDVEEETNLDDDAKVLKKRFERFGSLELNKTYNANSNKINSLRSFVLLYIRHYDSARILYVLKLLKSLILTDTRLVIQSLMNITHFSVNRNKMEQNIILDLFLRHKQSILGHEFHAPLPYDVLDNHANNSNYLELVISILLYFVRSYYPCKSIEADNLPDKTRDVDTTLRNNKQKNTSVDNVNEAANNKSKLMMVDKMNANKEVHINCCLLLKTIFHELTKIIASDIKAAFSVSELLIKSKVQKTILYSIYSNLISSGNCNINTMMNNLDCSSLCGNILDDLSNSGTYQNAFLSLIISLVQLEDQISLTKPDSSSEQLPKEFEQMFLSFMTTNGCSGTSLVNRQPSSASFATTSTLASSQSSSHIINDHHLVSSGLRKDIMFVSSQPVIYQPILLQAIIHSLSLSTDEKVHILWINFIHQLMPHLSKASTKIITIVLLQLCANIEKCQNRLPFYRRQSCENSPSEDVPSVSTATTITESTDSTMNKFSPDYYSQLIKYLTSLYHFCLFDSITCYSARHNLTSDGGQMGKMQTFSGQLVSGIFSAFTFQGSNKSRKTNNLLTSSDESASQMELCNNMLALLPNVTTTACSIWIFLTTSHSIEDDDDEGEGGCDDVNRVDKDWTQRMKQRILDLLNPIANSHQHSLLTALALLWNDNMTMSAYEDMVSPPLTRCHTTIIEIICQLKHVSFNSLLTSIKQIIKQPSSTTSTNNSVQAQSKYVSLEASLLQLLLAYMRRLPDASVVESTTAIITFIKDVFQANVDHTAVFVLVSILHCLLQKGPTFEERRDHKDIHDITYKLLEACSNVAGLSLEQANFFRRHLAVKSDLVADENKNEDAVIADEPYKGGDASSTIMMTSSSSTSTLNGLYQNSLSSSQLQLFQPTQKQPYSKTFNATTYSQSVQGLYVLAEVTATLLDVAFQSDEKDKVTPLLNNILSNVFPYLRNHRMTNSPSYTASSKLLCNLSEYQYTRRCWRKECMDLMLDANFFQMNIKSLQLWTAIADNLMSHDKSSFLDLLARFSLAQTSSLNLFSSREFESEQKRQLIKRLSFTLFCSEVDQYQKSMPDIQEKLSDCLRLPNFPALHAEVFNCFRVLVLRMSSLLLTSIWPTMITELIQVFVNIEQKLGTFDPDENARNYKTTDLLVDSNEERINLLYLSACKLLDLFIALPHENLPQFQLYKWAFIAESSSPTTTTLASTVASDYLNTFRQQNTTFMPHVVKISRLMQSKFGLMMPSSKVRPHQLTLNNIRVTSLRDLQEFFVTIASDASTNIKPFRHDFGPSSATETSKQSSIIKSKSYSNFTTGGPKIFRDVDVNPIEAIEQSILNDFLEKMT